MLKLRLQGTKENMEWFCGLLQSHSQVQVIQKSDVFSNKGTSKYYRMYVEIQNIEKVEDNQNV